MEKKTIHIEIASPDKEIFSGEVEMVIAPGEQGEIGVLPRHTYLMASLQPGEIRLVKAGKEICFAVSTGFMEVTPNKVLILADSSEAIQDINAERARKSRDRAKELLRKGKKDEVDFGRARLALMRAINRLKIAGGK